MITRIWPEVTVVCIGGGPSLTKADVDLACRYVPVIAINNAWQLIPVGKADAVLYACDGSWWKRHKGVPTFAGLKYALTVPSQDFAKAHGIQVLAFTQQAGLSVQPGHLFTGKCPGGVGNSGYQAVQLAVQLGARRIILLGYDMQVAPDGRTHWHPPHSSIRPPCAQYRRGFDTLVAPLKKLGIDVVNCSRQTALKAFPCRPLEDVLQIEVAA